MNTETYNKLHIINDEIKKIENAEKLLAVAREQLEGSIKIFNRLSNEIESTSKVLVPILKEYLEAIQQVRVAYGMEVQHMLRSSKELSGIYKQKEEMDSFLKSFIALTEAIRDEKILNNIKKVFNVENN